MGGLKRRVEQLEARADVPRKDEAAALSQEVLRRMTVDELRSYRDALERLKAAGGPPHEPPEEDLPILRRQQELYEEVRDELAPAP